MDPRHVIDPHDPRMTHYKQVGKHRVAFGKYFPRGRRLNSDFQLPFFAKTPFDAGQSGSRHSGAYLKWKVVSRFCGLWIGGAYFDEWGKAYFDS